MRQRGNDNSHLIGGQSLTDERGKAIDQKVVRLVELNDVVSTCGRTDARGGAQAGRAVSVLMLERRAQEADIPE